MSLFFSFIFLLTLHPSGDFKQEYIRPVKKQNLPIEEPSDLCAVPGKDFYFVVCDDGSVYKWFQDRQPVKLNLELWDAEGVCMSGNRLCVMEETPRRLVIIDTSRFSIVNTCLLSHQGGRNQSFESLSFDGHNQYLTCTEKNPAEFRLLNSDFLEIKRFSIDLIEEVSGISFHDGAWWVLSDEQSCVFVLNEEFQLIRKLKFSVLNPEGISFSSSGELMILSDDLHTVYYFNIP